MDFNFCFREHLETSYVSLYSLYKIDCFFFKVVHIKANNLGSLRLLFLV